MTGTLNLRNKIFYYLRPIIPRRLQLFIRRRIAAYKEKKYQHIWPIDPASATPPENWQGWPDNKKFALVLSHDVDTQKGHDTVPELMDLEEKLGFKSVFNFVPERYQVDRNLLEEVKARGFQLCIHGLTHDGRLFSSRKIFNERAKRINEYLKDWGAIGFTSPSMHHNLEWMHALNILHSTSTFDTDPFEPQPDSIRTIFPFPVYSPQTAASQPPSVPASPHPSVPPSPHPSFPASPHPSFYIELPYTLPQDHLLFVIMRHKTIDVWKKKLDWIAAKGGMALLNTHSDYMGFNGRKLSLEEYPIDYYQGFLEYVASEYKDQYWLALPRDVTTFWIQNIK